MRLHSVGSPYSFTDVNLPELIKEQEGILSKVLTEVIELMDADEEQHRQEHRGTNLADAFPDILGYYFSKISEAASEPSYFPLGAPHLNLVEQALAKFREMLVQRQAWGAYTGIDQAFLEVSHPISELNGYFDNPTKSRLVAADIPIFVKYLSDYFGELKDMAEELDRDYQRPALADGEQIVAADV